MTELEHRMILTNGIHLHIVLAGPEDGQLLVFLHGFPDGWHTWRRQIDHFTGLGFRVAAPDQRGYNLSDKPARTADYRTELLAEDIAGLITALGRERAVVIGHDWGAGVTWTLALRHPERLDGAVILNVPHLTVMSAHMRSSLRQLLRSWYMFFFQIPRLPEAIVSAGGFRSTANALVRSSRPGTFSAADLELYRQAWGQPGAMTAMMNWYRAALRWPLAIPNPRVEPPLLMLWGAQDAFLGRELAQPSIDLCARGRLVMFEQATHWLHLEEPQGVNTAIELFLRGL
ncbi:MAG: alpha/beta hydrolase [Anaerolineaceae bacterium]|nr:alpha/beta hydrolase [Anaerolineaceae bacterium]